ncbi:hydrolase [Loigolactobacillus backii]|uniref:Hydrolase n=1 Tax=Loigolactobacillus backii TaxID=375175 RepID=A0A192GZD1_9LACO|nr:hydrolase [Loigolactobacillus backii]ANK58935.1 hydrolase [Loigolactobacillus backii]ANK61393.1 hydrolase [Loigolactobacillus backii]ANK63923.1 hydrolase [Loigolactobacillus backii]ANK66371.1 hydrolase [Loigolactobacillus backii]ANK69407.1 hydrolase [Loigolactobacillus backii]
MTSEQRRDPLADELLTPENAAFLLIDYQPTQINSINSMQRAQLIENIISTVKIIQTYKIPVILSTVNVQTGRNKETIPRIKELLPGVKSYDRTTINAWEDQEFNAAVKATGRKKLIIAALWTEACLTFPTLDALREGYAVFPVVDSIGGTSLVAHEAALRRIESAGAQPTSNAQLACELQRDWNRTETAPQFVQDLLDAGIFLKLS